MADVPFTRRLFTLGGLAALPACSAISAINAAASALPTFDLLPVAGVTQGRRSNATFLVASPDAPEALATDRILIRPAPASITYLPDARWSESLPSLMQSLVVRSLSSTGRVGYVGPAGAGPIPDFAILARIDTFDIVVASSQETRATYSANVRLNVTVLRDANQRVIATRTFQRVSQVADLEPASVVAAFQSVLDTELVDLTTWIIDVSR